MRTVKFLAPMLLSMGTVLTAMPDSVEARPDGFHSRSKRVSHSRWHQSRRNVPELAAGSAAAGLALLGGGLMVMKGRRRLKRD